MSIVSATIRTMGEQARGYLRIGELSRRSGVSPELLRAWERRYGLLEPERTSGGFRLYTARDEARVAAIQANLARGLSAAEAARAALATPATAGPLPEPDAAGLAGNATRLGELLPAYDETATQAVLDRLFSTFSLSAVLRDVIIPYLHELGEQYARNEVSVAQEHFASNIVRGRLLALARGWGQGAGPTALLACAPGEQHDLGLLVFGLALRANGWRVAYLGADTPVATLAEAARTLRPDAMIVCAQISGHVEAAASEIAALAREAPLALAGAGVSPELALRIGAPLLTDDPVTAAERLVPERGA